MSKRCTGCVIVAVTAVLTGSAAAQRRQPTFVADAPALSAAIAGTDRVAPQFAQRLKQRREEGQPLFIIVPGILGSILHTGDPRNPFWGERGFFSGFNRDLLEFRDEPAQAAFMDNFAFLGEHDVYGKLRDHLKFYSFGKRQTHLEFAYDWRQDIRKSAENFDAFLNANRTIIDGRDVVIIAHSMGGLVVRWWYYTHYTDAARPTAYAFLRHPMVLFVGTPHYGSPSALIALAGKYGDGATFESVINYFTKDLNDVGASFYSAYELLPFGASSVIFRDKNGQEHANVDLLQPAIWETCNWGWRLRERKKMDRRKFYDSYLPERLDAAREFSTAMVNAGEDIKQNPRSICFYGDATETPATVHVIQTSDGCTLKAKRKERGDGRVLAEFTPFAATPHAHGASRRLVRPHMQLPQDSSFIQYIDDMRDASLAHAVLSAEPTLNVYTAFRSAGSLLPVPIGYERISEPETQAILAFNRAVLNTGRRTQRSDAELAELVYDYAHAAEDYSQTALRLYALAIALDPTGDTAVYAGNNIGDILVNADRWHEALPYLEYAKANLRVIDPKKSQLLQRFHNTIAVAYSRTGSWEDALLHYRLSGTREAMKNRTNLCRQLEELRIDAPDGQCDGGRQPTVAAALP